MSTKQEKEDLLKELESRTTAIGLLRYAHEYYASYELIQKTDSRITSYFAVKFYLLCHALELVMKAWLRHKGMSYPQMKALGHDLEKIMTTLYKDYNLMIGASGAEMISLVNRLYSNKEFEYALRGMKHVPEITDLAQTVQLLLAKARFDIVLGGDPRKLKALSEKNTEVDM